MLGLLEVGAIALLVAVLLLAVAAHSFAFEAFGGAAGNLAVPIWRLIGVLLVIGFGAKLGLLPFYEWFPAAYGAGSGASGALLSGVVLNAAFFGLSRGLLGMGAGPERRGRRRTWHFRRRRRGAERHSHRALRVSAGGLARAA